jgi:hypothetical protein
MSTGATPMPRRDSSNPVSAPLLEAEYPSGQVEILLVDDRSENLLALEAILEPLNQKLIRA